MELKHAADCLEALGNPTRLRIYRFLIVAGEDGVSVGAIKESLGIPGSTLTHHLAKLVQQNLVLQVRDGRALNCRANYGHMNELLSFLNQECCRGH